MSVLQPFSPRTLLLPYQRAWVDDRSRFKIGAWSRQTGKSFCTAAEAVESCLQQPGERWVCLSAGERQALEWLDKAKEWSEAYRLTIESLTEDRDVAGSLLRSADIRFANQSRIIAIPANPSTARGYSDNVVLDEFAHHESQDAIWGAMFPSITNPLSGSFLRKVRAALAGRDAGPEQPKRIRVVSTFNGRSNRFWRLWEHAKESGWSAHKLTIHDAKAGGLDVDIDALRAAMDDPDLWAQEYECDPTDASNTLLPYDLISLAETVDATEAIGADFWGSTSEELYCGIDFGRNQDPTVCWTWARVGDLLITREVLVLRDVSTPDQTAILSNRIARASKICLDYTGPGIGFGDIIAKEHGEWRPEGHQFGKVELCVFTTGFKREIFPRLRKVFEAPTRARIPVSREVREDLHAMQQCIKNGEYNYWAPRSKDGHSDRCTAAALGVRAAGQQTSDYTMTLIA